MKARPRSVERRVAEELSKLFTPLGMSEVKRLPVTGRTGPDIEINEAGLVVDVKSRKQVPKSSIAVKGEVLEFDNMIGVRLSDLPNLADLIPVSATPSVLVTTWLSHMHEWTVQNEPEGISCVIIHRPGMPVGNSTVIIYSTERNTLCQRMRSSSPATAGKPLHSRALPSASN